MDPKEFWFPSYPDPVWGKGARTLAPEEEVASQEETPHSSGG